MGVDDDVGGEPLACEQHVLLSVLDSAGSLLPVTRRELISDLRNANGAHPDLAELVTLRVEGDHDLIDNSGFTVPQEGARVSFGVPLGGALQLVVVFSQGYCLADNNIVTGNTHSRRDDAVVIQFVVDRISHSLKNYSDISYCRDPGRISEIYFYFLYGSKFMIVIY